VRLLCQVRDLRPSRCASTSNPWNLKVGILLVLEMVEIPNDSRNVMQPLLRKSGSLNILAQEISQNKAHKKKGIKMQEKSLFFKFRRNSFFSWIGIHLFFSGAFTLRIFFTIQSKFFVFARLTDRSASFVFLCFPRNDSIDFRMPSGFSARHNLPRQTLSVSIGCSLYSGVEKHNCTKNLYSSNFGEIHCFAGLMPQYRSVSRVCLINSSFSSSNSSLS